MLKKKEVKMINAIILTTEDIQDRHAYFENGKFYIIDTFDWKKFTSPTLKIQVEDGAMEDLYNQEMTAIDFAFTCLRRFNEFFGGAVQGFHPNSLILQGNCQEFHNQTMSIRNRLMDLIGWETTYDPDEPYPIDHWQKKTSESKETKTDTLPVVGSKTSKISDYFIKISEEFKKVGM